MNDSFAKETDMKTSLPIELRLPMAPSDGPVYVTETKSKRQRYPLLDLVRYIAALLVATFHWSLESGGAYSSVYKIPIIGNLVRNGAIGVPIFFVISGYVILETAWSKNALDFVIARFTRLFPSLLWGVLRILDRFSSSERIGPWFNIEGSSHLSSKLRQYSSCSKPVGQ